MYLTLVRFSLQGKDLTPLYSITTPWRIREQSERSGFSSFLVTFLSFLSKKKRKKVTKRFEIKEEILIKIKYLRLKKNNYKQRDLKLKKNIN